MLLKIGTRPDRGFDEPLGLLSDCHRRIEWFLGALLAIARGARGGPLTPVQRTQLEAAVEYFAAATPRHTADEEDSLFPRLRQAAGKDAERARDMLARLEGDHARAHEHHQRVDALVRGWLRTGSLDAADIDDLIARLTALDEIYRAHIAVEDEELFPLAARVLSQDQLAAIGGEMAARRAVPWPPVAAQS